MQFGSLWAAHTILNIAGVHTEVMCPELGCEYAARNKLSQKLEVATAESSVTAHTEKRWRSAFFHGGILLYMAYIHVHSH